MAFKFLDGEQLHSEGSIFYEEQALWSVSYLRERAHLQQSPMLCAEWK